MITLMKKKRIGGLMILCSILLLLLTGCGKHEEEPITSLKQLEQAGIKIAVALDSPQESSLAQDYPKAELIPYSDILLSYKDVASGKIDACVHARREMELAIQNGTRGVRLLEENYASNIIAVGISPVSDIPDLREKLNAFIAEKKADGTLDDMYNRWVVLEDDTMPEITQAENPTLTLRVGTTGTVMPYSYYRGTELVGYDIELAHRFAAWLGARLEFKVYDFGGIVPAAQSGNIDCIMSNLFYTPEKDESIPFSDPLFEVEITAMVRDTTEATNSSVDQRNGKAIASATGATDNVPVGGYSTMDQLDGKHIGVQTGTTAEEIVKERLPHVEISYFSTFPDMAVALETNKIDGFLGEGLVLTQMAQEDSHLKILDEKLRPYDCGFVLQKGEKGEALCAEINAWLGEMRESGELDRLLKKWTERPASERTIPDYKTFPAPKGTLTMTTEGTYPPMNYYRGEECVGMEIELSALFCEACGYGLNVTTMDFGSGMLAAVASGKVDFAASGIAITEERKQSVLFSDPYYTGGMMLAVLKMEESAPSGAIDSFSDLEDKRIGVSTGSVQALLAEKRFPDAKLFFFSNTVDMLNALRAHKIDAFADAEALVKYIMAENPDLAILEERLGDTMKVGAVFPKTDEGQALCDAFSDFTREIRQNGVYDEILDSWFGDDDSKRVVPDLRSLPKTNGTLRVAADTATVPFAFIKDGKPAGVDIDIVARFCKEKGYGLEIVQTDFSAIITSVVTGKVDFACGGIAYTPERAESVLYSEPTFEGSSVMAVLKTDETASAGEGSSSFWGGITSSFYKTFIRENRWQLFVKGVVNTLIITLLSILCGTLLGFLVFMLCRNGNPAANLITRFCLWLVQGMPMVVLLMVLYYIIFGSVAINGIAVAVIGFTLTFGASVYGLLKMGVGAVDGGQYEAAYALGYTNRRTFFRIILPQALPHVLPAYRGEIVGLIKATAVVGYIAVQDLTKMGDIVRSRTYEAFFPLIAVTVIYFLLEGLLRLAVSRITINLDPRRRKPEDILKGVKTGDQN